MLFHSVFAFFSSFVKAVNFAGTISPASLFLFSVTVTVRRLSAFAVRRRPTNAIVRYMASKSIFSVCSFMCHIHADCVGVVIGNLNCTIKMFCLRGMSLLNKRRNGDTNN